MPIVYIDHCAFEFNIPCFDSDLSVYHDVLLLTTQLVSRFTAYSSAQ
jgi:hypothetical protein